MATKKILVSDGSGNSQEISSASIGYNDVTNQISASKITAYNISSSLPTGVLLANGNFISSSVISATGQSGSLLQFSGSAYRLNLPTAIGGDLSGSTTALNNVKVISVANVNSGTLAFAYGGTGLTSSLSGVLIKGADNTLQVLASSDTGSVIGLNADGWFIDNTDPTTNYKPRVDVFTNTGTWTKKGNPRFLKVTIVGGGGGGGSGAKVGSSGGGSGGGGGGVTEVILEAANINSSSVTIGMGGTGGSPVPGASGSSNGQVGNPGAITYFSCSIGNFYATGGGGGTGGSNTATIAGGSSGAGNITSQGQSGGIATNNGNGGSGNKGLYTSGGGAGGGINTTSLVPRNGGASGNLIFIGDQTISASAGTADVSAGGSGKTYPSYFSTYFLNGSSVSNSLIFGTGGGGGGANKTIPATPGGSGGNAVSGSGGGGGGSVHLPSLPAVASGAGGRGGDGFVIIESY